MKNKILFKSFVVAIAALAMMSCKKKEDATVAASTATTSTTYTATNTPAKTKVATPSTLNKSATAVANIASPNFNMSAPSRPNFDAATKGENDAQGLAQAQNATEAMKSALKQVQMNMMFVDAAITNGSIVLAADATSGCQDAGVVTFTFTQAMFDAMAADMADYGLTDAEVTAELAGMASAVGQDMQGPAIHYYNATVFGVAGKGIQVGEYPQDGTVPSGGCTAGVLTSPTEIIMWSDDKTKLSYKATMSWGTDKIEVMATYDADTNISTFKQKGAVTFIDETGTEQSANFSDKATFRQCGVTTDNCVDFKVYTEAVVGGFSFKYDVRGRADNKGGFAKGKQFFTFNGVKDSMWMKEYFGADKKLTGLFFANNVPGADCFKTDTACTWNSVIAPTGTSDYETGAEDTTPGNKTFVFAYTNTFTSADDGEYMAITNGSTDVKPEFAQGMVVIEDGEAITADLFIPPTTSGTQYDLYKQTAFDKTTGMPTFSATKFDTMTVTF